MSFGGGDLFAEEFVVLFGTLYILFVLAYLGVVLFVLLAFYRFLLAGRRYFDRMITHVNKLDNSPSG